jgi:hypothetical protein
MTGYRQIQSRIHLVRRRWRTRMIVKGLSLSLVFTIALLVLGVWGADLFGFKPAAVWLARILSIGAVGYTVLRFLILPAGRRITDLQIARHVEERYPELQDRLVTSVEFGGNSAQDSGLVDLLIRDALDKTSKLDFSVFTGHRHLLIYGALGIGSALILISLMTWGPSYFHYGFDRLYVPWTEASATAGYTIVVEPGNAEIARGSDLPVKAQLIGFDSSDVKLFTLTGTGNSWVPQGMEPEQRGCGFLYLLVDLQTPFQYYVESKGIRSSVYQVSLSDMPQARRIDLHYVFPAYTGMPPQDVLNEGDISAVIGTNVGVSVQFSQPVKSSRLLLDDRSVIELARQADGYYSGLLNLRKSGSYVVQVETSGKKAAGSPEYEIRVLDDSPPKVSISRPMRDIRATNVEEVFAELKAEDDIGLGKLELHYSVNGAEEKSLILDKGNAGEKEMTAGHTFFLEEFKLQPGDVVSYYAKAFDNNNVSGPGTSSSDIYFIQIRPFDQKYTQNQQGGGGGGQGGGGGEEALSRQQKEIVSATFKLVRDKSQMEPKEFAEGLKALALVQGRLKVQAQGLITRLQRRGTAEISDEFQKLAEYLKAAADQMQEAATLLGAEQPSDALPREQKALQNLLRAESLFREIQISFSSQMGGGGGNQANAEDLADLFELELNKLKNQYETVRRGEEQARDQKADEALERLKELARRQQQLNEQMRNPGARGGQPPGGGAGGGQGQRQVMQEAENLRRQLQRLSRERSSPELNRVSSQLEKAIEEMKRSLEQQDRKNGQEAGAGGARALQQLEDAKQALSKSRQAGLSRGIEQAVEQSKQLEREQAVIQEGIQKLIQDKTQAASPGFQQRRKELIDKKTALAGGVGTLGKKIDELSSAAGKGERETESKLIDAASLIRDKKLQERISSGNQLLENGYYDFMKGREDLVRASLEDLSRQLESAQSSVGQTKEGKLEKAAGKTRELADGLESLRKRLQGRQGAQGEPANGQRSGQPENNGQRSGTGQQGGAQEQGARAGQNQNPAQGGGGQNSGEGRSGQAPGNFGSRDSSGQSGDNMGPPIGLGGPGSEGLRQLQRETQERLTDARELRRLLDQNPTLTQNLERIIGDIKNLNQVSGAVPAEQIARLKSAIDLLRGMEQDLNRDLSRLTQRERYLYSEENEVPGIYRKLVDEYFRALARIKP